MKKLSSVFIEYTKPYIDLDDIVRLKVNHTFRVVKLCEEIAKSLNMSEDDIELAKLCGLLHDIGRFEQWKRYQTFVDSKSIDHGDLGVEILIQNDFIRKFNEDKNLDSLILKTVKNHNKYKLEENLTEREKLFCNIVRDADKLDILYLYDIENLKVNIELDCFTKEIYESLLAEKQIIRTDCKSKTDFLSISLGFIFDLKLKKSFEILKDKNYMNEIIDIYKKKSLNKEFKIQIENIRETINDYIDRRCKNAR